MITDMRSRLAEDWRVILVTESHGLADLAERTGMTATGDTAVSARRCQYL